MGLSLALGSLGAVARAQEDLLLGRQCYEEKLALWQEIGDRTGIAATLVELGALAQQAGEGSAAQARFEEARALRHVLGDTGGVAEALAHLGDLACAAGDAEGAARLYRDGLDLVGAAGDRPVVAACLEGLAVVAMGRGRLEHAARLCGAATALRRGSFVLAVGDRGAGWAGRVAALHTVLPHAAWAAGEALPPDAALAEALAEGTGAGDAPP
jgi:tetratricopeptide (TPR) repeat protein